MAAALLLVAVLGGCRGRESGEVSAVVIAEALPKVADPASGTLGPADLLLVGNAAQGLVRFDSAGNIAPGLAERWAVSDDGLSYVFRLQKAEWSDGRPVRARDVVRLLQRQVSRASRNPLKDAVGAVRGVVAMTDRVVAIELSAPRPHLLQLLAQPEFGLVRDGGGTGPFRVTREEDALLLTRTLPVFDGDEPGETQKVRLRAAPAGEAVAAFVAGRTELVLGGTVADLGTALGARLPRGALRVDPVAGLFGLLPARRDGPAGDSETRALLDAAIDRAALVAALGVPQLQPRTSLLQPGLDGPVPAEPAWAGVPLQERRAALVAKARQLFPDAEAVAQIGGEEAGTPPAPAPVSRRSGVTILVALPDGPGGAIILERLRQDWGILGLEVARAERNRRADFRWVDSVAPSVSPAWFLRSLRCEAVPVCLESADRLLDAARLTGFAPQRSAFFAEAEAQMRDSVLFMPVAAPVRWSLVGRSIGGFNENRFARHPLTDLRQPQDTRD